MDPATGPKITSTIVNNTKSNPVRRPPQPKKIHSLFLLTVNTNVAMQPSDPRFDDFVKLLTDGITDMIDNHSNELLKIRKANTDFNSHVLEIKAENAIEIGRMHGKIHDHSLILVSHRTSVHIDTAFVQKFMNQAMGFSGAKGQSVHVDVKWIPYKVTDALNVREYVLKYYNNTPVPTANSNWVETANGELAL